VTRDGPRAASAPGELAIVLHTHMPYVEGFGTWPFGEEWLWEAIATSYLPLLRVLGRAPLTLSLTPVLCDQLEQPDTIQRCLAFLRGTRSETHARDAAELRARGELEAAAAIERSGADYQQAADRLAELTAGRGLLAALGQHSGWTSAATHAVLPLLATDPGVALQLQNGIASYRRRFGAWDGGLWLPECAHAPWLDPLLEAAGVRAVCVELTNRFGLGDRRHLQPLASEAGPVLWPIDRSSIALVWGEHGYPARAPYRDYHGYTTFRHRAWRNDGAPYDHAAAQAQVQRDAEEFVVAVAQRVHEGGLCVCALDTELLGHWWYEGVDWLAAVIAAAERHRLALTTLDAALERHAPVSAPRDLAVTSWGEGGDLRTWSAPRVADFAFAARRAELALAATDQPSPRALRELLALQASDWAFLAYRATAGDYPQARVSGHREALTRALAADPTLGDELRGLAPDFRVAPFG
jgi:1,4-alpha-glucan branching enzyme